MVVDLYASIFHHYYTPSLAWLQHDEHLIIGAIQGKKKGT